MPEQQHLREGNSLRQRSCRIVWIDIGVDIIRGRMRSAKTTPPRWTVATLGSLRRTSTRSTSSMSACARRVCTLAARILPLTPQSTPWLKAKSWFALDHRRTPRNAPVDRCDRIGAEVDEIAAAQDRIGRREHSERCGVGVKI
jgi:hypothetical protein